MYLKHIVTSLIVVATLSGCTASVGTFDQTTGTDVSLRGNNYKVVKAGVRGESTGFSLLGFIPIKSPNYADAKSNLYQSIGQSLEGRSVALANQTNDRSSMYYILFSIPRIVVTADVVEFDAPPQSGEKN